ncbi:hypothetical protein [Traorella massiliensis]|uniref:hypothetical protein n=1 Tax=Traorella massiliensis TaxID=1903263 RepID=UPI00248EC0FE|nr:hypothetical protein [Traorella massiliensis]
MMKEKISFYFNYITIGLIILFSFFLAFDITKVLGYFNGEMHYSIGSNFQPLLIIYVGELMLLFFNQEPMEMMVTRYTFWLEYIIDRICRNMVLILVYLISVCLILFVTGMCNILEVVQVYCYQCFTAMLFVLIMIFFEKIGKKDWSYIFFPVVLCSSIITNNDFLQSINILYGLYPNGPSMQISHFIIYLFLYAVIYWLITKGKEIAHDESN